MADSGTPAPSPRSTGTGRRPWVAPRVDTLPRLTDLTLLTAPIEANCPIGGGSTCF